VEIVPIQFKLNKKGQTTSWLMFYVFFVGITYLLTYTATIDELEGVYVGHNFQQFLSSTPENDSNIMLADDDNSTLFSRAYSNLKILYWNYFTGSSLLPVSVVNPILKAGASEITGIPLITTTNNITLLWYVFSFKVFNLPSVIGVIFSMILLIPLSIILLIKLMDFGRGTNS
jgi:hypothetical protein